MGLQPEMSLMRKAKVASAPEKGGAEGDLTFCLVLLTPPPTASASSAALNSLPQIHRPSSSLIYSQAVSFHFAHTPSPTSSSSTLNLFLLPASVFT